jgi:hypothetical protein
VTGVRVCHYCDEPGVVFHHLTGRSLAGVYLDPDLVVRLCGAHHALDHRAWRELQIDAVPDPTQARILRLRFFFVRLSCLDEPVVLAPKTSRALGHCLSEILGSYAAL